MAAAGGLTAGRMTAGSRRGRGHRVCGTGTGHCGAHAVRLACAGGRGGLTGRSCLRRGNAKFLFQLFQKGRNRGFFRHLTADALSLEAAALEGPSASPPPPAERRTAPSWPAPRTQGCFSASLSGSKQLPRPPQERWPQPAGKASFSASGTKFSHFRFRSRPFAAQEQVYHIIPGKNFNG